ncbi:MAG: hypothetical protein IJX77_10410 [Ruminococcus sp.]|nr:hypothetical protein [Ruminococcus sp.]
MGSWLVDDIILDESAFSEAISGFADLSTELQNLRNDIEGLLAVLKTGFDTPAGRKFISSCEKNLLEPLDRQKLVLEHISGTLKEAKGSYSTVFTEYEELNAAINSYQF